MWQSQTKELLNKVIFSAVVMLNLNTELSIYSGGELILTLIPFYAKIISFTLPWNFLHSNGKLLAGWAKRKHVLVSATRNYAWFG